jgi:hypothetical protein
MLNSAAPLIIGALNPAEGIPMYWDRIIDDVRINERKGPFSTGDFRPL